MRARIWLTVSAWHRRRVGRTAWRGARSLARARRGAQRARARVAAAGDARHGGIATGIHLTCVLLVPTYAATAAHLPVAITTIAGCICAYHISTYYFCLPVPTITFLPFHLPTSDERRLLLHYFAAIYYPHP